jgi:hypothetical protein
MAMKWLPEILNDCCCAATFSVPRRAISTDRSLSLYQLADVQHDLREHNDGHHHAQRHKSTTTGRSRFTILRSIVRLRLATKPFHPAQTRFD